MSVLSQTVTWMEEGLNIPCSTEDWFCFVTNKCLLCLWLLKLGSISVTGCSCFSQEIKGRFTVAFNLNAPVEFEYFSQLYWETKEGSLTGLSTVLHNFLIFFLFRILTSRCLCFIMELLTRTHYSCCHNTYLVRESFVSWNEYT